ncbi:3-methyl-2-oxobutanoate hydroxymethyltransferase [Aliamphritea spongicola]|nr:3-methyl-2-oxobutanoate hydroxymethyltransferase [Aliamphritea spongicola]
MVSKLASFDMPVMGHAGLIPRKSTWIGGLRAFGRTAEEAMELYRQFKRLEDAGAWAVEVEVVPTEVLAAINMKTKLVTTSIGAGSGGM